MNIKIKDFFIHFFIFFSLFIFQFTIISKMAYPINKLQIFLSLLSVMSLLYKKNMYLWIWWIIFAVILNSYSIYPFFIIPLILICTILISNFSFNNFFTNQSYYSLIVVCFIVTIFYNTFLLLLSYIIDIFYFQNANFIFNTFFINLLWQILLNSLMAIVFFIFLKKIKYAK